MDLLCQSLKEDATRELHDSLCFAKDDAVKREDRCEGSNVRRWPVTLQRLYRMNLVDLATFDGFVKGEKWTVPPPFFIIVCLISKSSSSRFWQF